MSDLPVSLPAGLEPVFLDAFDPPGKLVAAIAALGQIEGREVLVAGAAAGPVVNGLRDAGARVTFAPEGSPIRFEAPDASADVVVGLWSAFRGVDPEEIAEVDRVLRAGGRHLVIHDYGRDDVSRLFPADRPEYGAWSHRFGPFLKGGFRVRVVHCFWEFASLDAASSFLAEAFGAAGADLAATLKRPRLSYNVAVYHRARS